MYLNYNWNSNDEGNRNDSNEHENVDDEEVQYPIEIFIIFTFAGLLIVKYNVYLIIACSKREFYGHNMFYTIVHWSFANLLHSILPTYLLYVPAAYRNETMTLAFVATHSIVSAFTLNIAICFAFDKFINSKDFCRRMIRSTWLFFSVCLAVVLSLVCTNILNEFWITYVSIAYSSIALLIFIVRLLYFCSKGSEEETFRLRVSMSGVFIVSSYLFTVWRIMNVIEVNWVDFWKVSLLGISLITIVCNGILNFVLVFLYQKQLRSTLQKIISTCLCPCRKLCERDVSPKDEGHNEELRTRRSSTEQNM